MIVRDEQRAVMEFIATANRGGYRPTGREIREWRVRPDPRPRRRGELLEPAVPEVPDRRVRKRPSWLESAVGSAVLGEVARNQRILDVFGKSFPSRNYLGTVSRALDAFDSNHHLSTFRSLGLAADYEVIPGRPGRPARYGPDKPAEKFLAHLRRLGWIERDKKGGHGVTRLGHALLRAEAAADSGGQDAAVMVLAAEDELAYGRVLGVISECGEALIVDGYLDTGELVHILKDSNASRFLVSSKLGSRRLTELAMQVRLTPSGADGVVRELRCGNFHDRYLIGDDKVYGLGSSLNGVGKNLTTLMLFPDFAAQIIREAERWWAEAELIAYTGDHLEVDDDPDQDDVPADSAERSPSSDGGFRHNGCSIRHRSQQAAENCTKGAPLR